ncbi:MAG: nucleoside kinase [Paludibacteraceae bacterium]|jgi:uridine kinase|nr:nucleoside kinase [Paludibacteraceae bacterium]MBP8966528.1 nucleoside kinase [Paludibacteraceae bacterium]HOF98080.1 nucleoside kinase [Paludibacteraceae bacterium]HOJ65428.1 nucleoside kinase [Paludibacteraceae bacterium]HOR38641.1 nucleoside kinase [Paludibacteraceae bacterium]
MGKTVTIYCKNTRSYHDFPLGTSLIEIYRSLNIQLKYQVVAARVNYKVEDLNFLIYKPKDIEFIDLSTSSGMRVYVRTLTMVVAKAVSELFPKGNIRIEHPLSKGYYCVLNNIDEPLTQSLVDKIKERINLIISQGKTIICEEKQTSEVIKLFADQKDKIVLFQTLGNPYCRYFRIDDYIDYYNGVLLPSTDYLNLYDLIPYYDGLLLRVPNRENPTELEEIVPQPKLYDIFKEYVEWNKIMNLSNVGEFNVACRNKQAFSLIKISEALHEKKVATIADTIAQRKDKVKFILISGPSSSGKTTFSKRLSVQLAVCRIKPVAISLDNYFVDRDKTPRDENGELDFEHLHALDLELLNQQLRELIEGKEIELPSFNFEEGRRYYRGDKLKLAEDSLVILEGIHALNPKLLPEIPAEATFKIYVSALTTISIDNHNWIPTTDTRLLRRIIRDSRYRNYSARETIARWESVRKGEEKWIFPFQENADVMFNSALLFEFAVLKRYAEPLLAEVPKYCDEYTEAHRLIKFLNYFVPIPDREIPPTSLLREFVGGSSFRY